MSASLVGSEMCIRDSPRTTTTTTRMRPTSVPLSGACIIPPRLRPTPAVSYTHLTLPTICSV
eukprot:4810430-Alexandrium_andersonii.AAC.1